MFMKSFKLAAVSAAFLALTACSGGSDDPAPVAEPTPTPTPTPTPGPGPTPAPTPAPTALPTRALGLTDERASLPRGTSRLVGFDIATPNTLTTDVVITAAAGPGAFATGEWIFGMDYRPSNGVLYGLSNRGRLYTIDPGTGVATFTFALTADPADTTSPFTALDTSTSVSVDFNPVADRMRVVTFGGQNLSINVASGLTTTDTPAPAITAPPAPFAGQSWVAGVAYSNSFAGATATTLYTINNQNDNLSTQTPPASGTQTAVGALGVAIDEVQGLDIAGSTNQLVLGALRAGTTGPHSLYNITLSTGAAALRPATTGTSVIGGATGLPLVDIAIRP